MSFSGTADSDFMKLSQIPEVRKSDYINFAATDFDSIKDSLLQYINAVYPEDYNNFYSSELGIMLVELISYMGAVTSFKADALANECFIGTVKTRDNLRNLLLTNHGERLGQYDFGANLTELTFELGTDKFDTEAMLRISKAITKFMPYVQLLEYKPFNEKRDGALARAGFSVSYSVPLAKLNNQKIELILYAAG